MRKYHVEISGRSVGGSNYVSRILKEGHNRKNINVLVSHGAAQEKVVKMLKFRLAELDYVAKHSLKIKIFKECPQF